MTTPEALKARQLRTLKWLRIEGFVLGLVLMVVGLDELHEEREQARQSAVDERQELCLTRQVTALTDALNARSSLTQKLNDATAGVLDSFAQAAAKPDQENPAPIIKALKNYAQTRDDVAELRKTNPFPPFPSGRCE